jgi:hypothetical protein
MKVKGIAAVEDGRCFLVDCLVCSREIDIDAEITSQHLE